MKLRSVISALGLASACFLFSCASQDEHIDKRLSPEELRAVGTIGLSFDAEQEYAIDEEGRALTFNVGNETTYQSLTHSESSLPVHIYIKSTDTSQPVTVATLSLNRKVAGGKDLNLKFSTLELKSGTDLTRGTWYLLGVIGGTLDPSGVVNFATSASLNSNTTASLDLPFTSDWVKITDVKYHNGRTPSIVLESKPKFKPQGAVIRATAKNIGSDAYSVTGYSVQSNTGGATAKLDPMGSLPSSGRTVLAVATPGSGSLSKSFTSPIPLPPATDEATPGKLNSYFLLWMMPFVSQPASPSTVINLQHSGGADLKIYTSTKVLKNAYLYRVEGLAGEEEVELPLARMAEYNLAEPGRFANSHWAMAFTTPERATFLPDYFIAESPANRDTGAVYSQPYSITYHRPDDNFIPSGYRIPTADDWASIFTQDMEASVGSSEVSERYEGGSYKSYFNNTISPSDLDLLEDSLAIDKDFMGSSAGTSTFKVWGTRVALRYDARGSRLRSAWKYEFFGDLNAGADRFSGRDKKHRLYIRISAIPDKVSTLQQISQKDYWVRNKSKMVTRYLQYFYDPGHEHHPEAEDQRTHFYTAVSGDQYKFLHWGLTDKREYGAVLSLGEMEYGYYRLFKN